MAYDHNEYMMEARPVENTPAELNDLHNIANALAQLVRANNSVEAVKSVNITLTGMGARLTVTSRTTRYFNAPYPSRD